MRRWEFRAGLILLGWGPVEAAIELGTSPGTVMTLEAGEADDLLGGTTIERASAIFERHQLAIQPVTASS